MFFILSKLFHLFIFPFTWLVVLFLIGLLVKNVKLKKRYLFSAFAVLILYSNTVIFKEFARVWEVPGKNLDKMNHYDVGIVLGGMAEYNNDLDRLSIRRGGDRIWQAISLYKRGKIDKILISGDDGLVIDRGLKEALRFKKELVIWGIPSEDILVDTISKNTYQNAVESIKVLKKAYGKVPSCLLITSATHMKRSKACFVKLGVSISTFSTDHYTGPKRSYHWDEYFVPNVSTMYSWEALMHEWVGFVAYKIRGYC